MKNKTLLKECKCIHCQQKLEQINNSRLYWDKLILSKTLAQPLLKIHLNAHTVKPKIAFLKIYYVEISNNVFRAFFESSLN